MSKIRVNVFSIFAIIFALINCIICGESEESSTDVYVIEGKVFPLENTGNSGWQLMTHVMANGGEHYGFLRFFKVFQNVFKQNFSFPFNFSISFPLSFL